MRVETVPLAASVFDERNGENYDEQWAILLHGKGRNANVSRRAPDGCISVQSAFGGPMFWQSIALECIAIRYATDFHSPS